MSDQNRSPPVLPQTPWRDRVFQEIDIYIEELGRTQEESRHHLSQLFPGCVSRRQLADQELQQLSRRLSWELDCLLDEFKKNNTKQNHDRKIFTPRPSAALRDR
jgi:hypothetical protein